MKITYYNNRTFQQTSYYKTLNVSAKEEFDILSKVFHFKVNSYVLENLIDWKKAPYDPMFRLVFPRKEMLPEMDYELLKMLVSQQCDEQELNLFVQRIKQKLFPQVRHAKTSLPRVDGKVQKGMYRNFDTIISLFPDPMMKTCHAYCSYCFRWIMFNNKEAQENSTYSDPLTPVAYIRENPKIKDVLFTGADPMVLKADKLRKYIEPVLDIDSVEVIRISSKSLAWLPQRFISDPDAEALLDLFKHIISSGKHLNFCAHFTHPKELETEEVKTAIRKIQETGAVIRCQGPLVKGINDDPEVLSTMWSKQVAMGMIPYYLFVEADHNPESCFRIPLANALSVFQSAQRKTTGLARTIRGPVFMNDINRVLLDGTTTLNGEKYFVLKTLQGPPESHSEGKIKLIPYDDHILSAGNLFELFMEEEMVV